MRPNRVASLACTALAGVLSWPALAADVYVIANNSLAITAEEIRDVYLGDKQIAGGTKLVPVDNAAQQKDFLDKALKVDAAKYNSIWIKKGFRDGLNAPAMKSGDAEVISAVKANAGAIGYVSSAPKDLKVVGKF
jgi:ABC-type phosphate transport system substrate-binding protein